MVEDKGFAISLRPDKLRTIKSPPSSVTYLTFDEFDNIAQSIDTTILYDLRFRTLVEVLYGTGQRIAEALRLKRNQFVGNKARIVGKGQRERTVSSPTGPSNGSTATLQSGRTAASGSSWDT